MVCYRYFYTSVLAVLASGIFAFLQAQNPFSSKSDNEVPAWISQTILEEGDFFYSVGYSTPKSTEQEARDEAVITATTEFVRYCKVDIQSFTRSMEAYAEKDGKSVQASDTKSQIVASSRAFVSQAIPVDWYVKKDKKKFVGYVMLKVPKSEFDRIVNEKNVKISLDVLFYTEDTEGKMRSTSEGEVLRSGDGYALFIRPSDQCWVYVYQIDAVGNCYQLFPNEDFNTETNPMIIGDGYWIPNSRELFYLDETTGRETIYIFAALEKIAEFEKTDTELTKSDLDDVIQFKKMGVAGVKPKRNTQQETPPKKTTNLVDIKNKLQGEGAFVNQTWFWHK